MSGDQHPPAEAALGWTGRVISWEKLRGALMYHPTHPQVQPEPFKISDLWWGFSSSSSPTTGGAEFPRTSPAGSSNILELHFTWCTFLQIDIAVFWGELKHLNNPEAWWMTNTTRKFHVQEEILASPHYQGCSQDASRVQRRHLQPLSAVSLLLDLV